MQRTRSRWFENAGECAMEETEGFVWLFQKRAVHFILASAIFTFTVLRSSRFSDCQTHEKMRFWVQIILPSFLRCHHFRWKFYYITHNRQLVISSISSFKGLWGCQGNELLRHMIKDLKPVLQSQNLTHNRLFRFLQTVKLQYKLKNYAEPWVF